MKAATALFATSYFAHLGLCALGIATTYKPPYLPNKCYGNNQAQVPSDGYFGAVGQGLWDNGGACGRHYRLRCVSTPQGASGRCTGKTITIKIIEGKVGYRSADLAVSTAVGGQLYTGGGQFNIEYELLRN